MAPVLLKHLAPVIRSKNAGPFVLTLDVFFADEINYRLARDSGAVTPGCVAELYKISEDDVIGVYFFEPAFALKVSIRRPIPSANPGDSDVFGAQQHVPLMNLVVSK